MRRLLAADAVAEKMGESLARGEILLGRLSQGYAEIVS